MGSQIAHNYASALYELVLDRSLLKEYQTSLREFSSLLEKDKDLYLFLESYSIPYQAKDELLKKIYQDEKLEHLVPFISLVCKKHRINIFKQIEEEFSSMVNEFEGVAEGLVYTSYRLNEKDLKKIEEALGKRVNKKVRLKNLVEPSILGGVKVLLEGKVYDGSLRNKLLEMEKSLLEKR